MEEHRISVQAMIDSQTFSEFALFDVMQRQKRWLRPVLFAAFFVTLSLLAFSRQGKAEQAELLAWVMLAIGLSLPVAYFGNFLLSVHRRSRSLRSGEAAYTLELDGDCLIVKKAGQTVQVLWQDLFAVYRLKNSICLYTDGQHAFLLPRRCGDETFQAAWSLIENSIEPAKLRAGRKQKRRYK